jgi:hypothetical protein
VCVRACVRVCVCVWLCVHVCVCARAHVLTHINPVHTGGRETVRDARCRRLVRFVFHLSDSLGECSIYVQPLVYHVSSWFISFILILTCAFARPNSDEQHLLKAKFICKFYSREYDKFAAKGSALGAIKLRCLMGAVRALFVLV